MKKQETKPLLENALRWFRPHFRQSVVTPVESHFPNNPYAREVQDTLDGIEAIVRLIESWSGEISLEALFEKFSATGPTLGPLFNRIMLLYRRHRAAETERLTEKTFHLELAASLEEEVKALESLTSEMAFLQTAQLRLPKLKDFLPVQFIESAAVGQVALQPRQHDEKFHILQAPSLFFPDVAYFRSKCEDRETPLAIAFLDIDGFKAFNSRYMDTKVDRNLLPRFMQTIEAHIYHHGFAYRQGGDEYLILIPSFSRPLAIGFLDELRARLANLSYPEIEEKTTVSIGLCIVDPDCPLTDRELLDRANKAKEFAKNQGKNRIATYSGLRMDEAELQVVP